MVCVVGIYNGTLFAVLVPRNSCSTISVVDIPEQFRKKQQFLSPSTSSSCGLTMNEEEERSGAILLWLTAVELRYALEVPLRGWTTSRSTDHNNNNTTISTSEPSFASSSSSSSLSLLSAAIPFRSEEARQRFEHLSSLPTIELHYHVYRYLTLELGWALRHAEAMYGVAWIGYRGDVRQGHGECLIDVRAVSATKEQDDDDNRENKEEEEIEVEAVVAAAEVEAAVVGRRWSLDVVANRLARSVGKQLVVAVVMVTKDRENEKEEEEDEEDGKENHRQRQRTFGKVSLWKNGQRWDAK